jgi:hypothetical protein
VESVVAHGITDVSDMRQDTLQMPDDLTDEDEGKTKDDEKILCSTMIISLYLYSLKKHFPQ